MKHSKHPFLPITRVAQGQHNTQFEGAFDDTVPVSGAWFARIVCVEDKGA